MEKIMKNVMETIVKQRMEDMLPNLDCCKCEQCQMDILALVLNRMPAKYVVSTKGAILTRLDSYARQGTADVTAEIMRAVDIVTKNPRHDD